MASSSVGVIPTTVAPTPVLRKGASQRLAVRLSELEALRVDVHDGLKAGAAHRGRRRGEQAGGRRGDAARLRGLGDQLCTMAAAQAEKRRRTDCVGVTQTATDLLEQPAGVVCVPAGYQDAHDVAVRRVRE